MAGIKRRRRSPEAWLALLERQPASGLTVEAFCLREGVSTASFYRWRGLRQAGAANTVAGCQSEPAVHNRCEFFDIGAISGNASPSAPAIHLLLQIGGFRLQLERV